jgi:hypothetical protein
VAPAPGQVRILLSEVGVDGSLGAWRETLGIAEDRDGPSAAIVGDFLYVLGGGQQSQASVVIGHLDPQTGDVLSWSADPADSLVGQPKRPAVLARGNRLYVLGGSTAPGQMADIDLKTGHFSSWR